VERRKRRKKFLRKRAGKKGRKSSTIGRWRGGG
jgi:hypothetical protein